MKLEELELGKVYALGNLEVKVTQGRRGARRQVDRIIWIRTEAGSWCPVSMEAIAGVAALIAENEEAIWPRPRFKGAGLWREMLRLAVTRGIVEAMEYKAGTHRN